MQPGVPRFSMYQMKYFNVIQKAHSLIESVQSEGVMTRPDMVFAEERGRAS